MESRIASAAFILVVATYIFLGGMGVTDRDNPAPRDAAYNLLARGLLSGHLYLDKAAPAALTGLKDPLDPEANRIAREDPRYRLHDLSYRKGRLYLYFGAAPAVLVFIPWHLLTGGWLPHWGAVVLLCAAGLAANVVLVRSVRSRIFPKSPGWVLGALVLLLGLGSYAPLLAARADMWEVPVAFNYFAVSMALWFFWKAVTQPEKAVRYIAFASCAFGAAFLSRPTVLVNAAILLLLLAPGGVRGRPSAWAASVFPLAFCGAAAGLYNVLRFGGPFDFGESSQLAGVYVAHLHTFDGSYVWTNLRLYLVQGVDWSWVFPFAHEPAFWRLEGSLPVNHGGIEHVAGALVSAPILWAALAVPFFIRLRRPDRSFLLLSVAAGWVALSSLLLFAFFFGTSSRYQFEFVPGLALLASFGVLAMESVLRAGTLVLARCVWIPLVLVSGAFAVLYGIDRCATDHNEYAVQFLVRGNTRAAEHEIETAQFLSPGNPFSRILSGVMLAAGGHMPEARQHFEVLVRDFPNDARAHFWLGNVLAGMRQWEGAKEQHRLAHELSPADTTIAAAWDADLARAVPQK